MPDVIAEQGALQDAIESPSTSVSRLGAAGWMKGKVADLNAIGVTENVSRLAAAGRIMGGIYDADPLATSTFYAPLLTTLVLSRGTGNPTFTRATTAYVKDFEDVWREVPSGAARFEGARVVRNAFPAPENLNGVGWTKQAGAVVTQISGGEWEIDLTACADNVGVFVQHSGTILVGSTAMASVYLWMDSQSGNGTLTISEPAGSRFTTYDAVLTTTETRYATPLFTVVSGSEGLWFKRKTGGAGALIFRIKYPQLENVSGASNQSPGEYVSNGVLSAPYHGAGVDGIKYFATENGNSVASGVVTEATGAAIPDATLKGYFAEGQRQNRCLYSQDFSNAAWVSGGGGIAVTPNTAVAPDGTTTADTLTASGANGTLIQDLGVVASAAKAGGMWLKRKTGTGNIDLTLDGGATWTTVAVTSSWLLLEKSQTLADEDFGIRIVTSGDAVYAWTAQVETKVSVLQDISSPIPTTTAAVTRNADILGYPASGNINSVIGTVFCEAASKNLNPAFVSTYTASGGMPLTTNGSGYVGIYDNTNYKVSTLQVQRDEVQRKYASKWDATSGRCYINGTGSDTTALDGDLNLNTNMYIGNWSSDNAPLYGAIKNVRIWTKALTDATLQSITT